MTKNSPNYRFVADMFNICYMTGFVRNIAEDGSRFQLQQNNNRDQFMDVIVPDNIKIPAEKTPVTVLCHIHGRRNERGDAIAEAVAFDIQRPSIRAMPPLASWTKGQGKPGANTDDEFRPFNSGPGVVPSLKGEFAEQVDTTSKFTEAEQILRDILEATRGKMDTRLSENSNVVNIAGFINSMAWVEPTEMQENGYGLIMLRQHANPDKCVPIHLESPAAKAIMKRAVYGMPIMVAGRLRKKVVEKEIDGEKVKVVMSYVKTPELYTATLGKDIKESPAWWGEMRDRAVAEMNARKKAKEELAALDNM